ncbi:60S ribosomal protein L22 [Candidatus Bathyarchaeota archaeon]|nr:60S ribosomal protein L22 [Candidatus Bathyarchaeota archaeon]
MVETRINISELKSEGSEVINQLTDFLKEKAKVEVETTADAIIVKGEGKNVSKKHLRILLKRFLHQNELKDYFRVIGEKENTLMVKEKKTAEEEEE